MNTLSIYLEFRKNFFLSVLARQRDTAVIAHAHKPSPGSNSRMDIAVNQWRDIVDEKSLIIETFYTTWNKGYYCRVVHLSIITASISQESS